MSKQYITSSAYLDELQSWQSSLKQLIKQITLLQKSSDLTKTFQTDIQILVTEMQSELLKYRREKTKIMSAYENLNQFSDIITNYQMFNERFNIFMQRANKVIEEINENTQVQNKRWTTNRSKQQKSYDKTKSKMASVKKSQKSIKGTKTIPYQRPHIKSFQQTRAILKKPGIVSVFQTPDTELKLQFVSLKNNIQQLHKSLDTHQHPLIDQQINKLKLSNSKILMDIKMLKQQHAYMQNQIFQMKKQINQQRKAQLKIVKKHRQIVQRSDIKVGNNVPQWVRIRLNNKE